MEEDIPQKLWLLERQVFQLQTLFEIAQALNHCHDLQELYSLILATMVGTFGAREGLALVVENGQWRSIAYRGRHTKINKLIHKHLAEAFHQATARQQQETLEKLMNNQNWVDPSFTLWEHVRVREKVVGGFYFDRKIIGEPYSRDDESLLRAVCSYAAHVLENITLYQELEKAHRKLAAENISLRQQVQHEKLGQQILGNSPALQEVRSLIQSYSQSEAPVLISGETGTGKELVAKAIHDASPRAAGPFVAINCAAIPENLVESEFFGIEEGVATGVKMHNGYFEQADGGTLFIDEIGDMPSGTQAKLLRILQEQTLRRVGGNREIKINVRVLAATNKDLHQEILNSRFREDLFYRLSVLDLEIPPLRQRKEDIALLAKYFLDLKTQRSGRQMKGFSPRALQLLENYSWPGNIRELENEIERLVAIVPKGEIIQPQHLSARLNRAGESNFEIENLPKTLRQAVNRLETKIIKNALQEAHGNKSEVARRLGLSRLGLQRKMERLDISYTGLKNDAAGEA